MSEPRKTLTKKQRKTAEFRSKATKETPSTSTKTSDDVEDVSEEVLPVLEKGKEKADGEQTTTTTPSPASRPKRKREEVEEGLSSATTATTTTSTATTTKADAKRYIVFVGNMAYKTTSDDIVKHFHDHCGERPNVRLLTSKASANAVPPKLSKSKQKSIAKGKASMPTTEAKEQSKGCAFVEFTGREALQKALQFHHTTLHGRTINVELTAGGGGRSAGRKEKIERKNKVLEEERKKLHEKYVKTAAAAAKKSEKPTTTTTEDKSAPQKPHWGPNANGGAQRKTKVPKWAASGANAVRLNG